MARIFALLLLLVVVVTPTVNVTEAAASRLAILDGYFLDANGAPIFLLGANYEGPADRAWRMWDDDRFDAGLISWDFHRARVANLSTLRIFVQQRLAEDILADRWSKLDTVMDLADQQGLRVILTFADYGEMRLANLAAIDAKVAARYRYLATILANDLKNEPRFSDLALAVYPPGVAAALQNPSLVAEVGETVPRLAIPELRQTELGHSTVPARLTDDQAYVYVNLLAAYGRFQADAAAWASLRSEGLERPVSGLRFVYAEESKSWDTFEAALNQSFGAWMKPRLDAIRAADPLRPVTVGQVDPYLAALPVNLWLDYRSIHRYPHPSHAGVESTADWFDDLRTILPDSPLMLGEFGFSNDGLGEQESADLERDLVLAVRDRGGAGALKWMLNDFPQGFNPRENAFGMYRGDGSPKPVVFAFQALGALRPVPAITP